MAVATKSNIHALEEMSIFPILDKECPMSFEETEETRVCRESRLIIHVLKFPPFLTLPLSSVPPSIEHAASLRNSSCFPPISAVLPIEI